MMLFVVLFVWFFSLTLLAVRPYMDGYCGQMRMFAAFIPELRFHLEQNVL